jgi:hypothetical protein
MRSPNQYVPMTATASDAIRGVNEAPRPRFSNVNVGRNRATKHNCPI